MIITLDENHVYRVDGVVKPSVHEVLNAVGLADTTYIDEYYLTRGSFVHQCCDWLDSDDLDWSTLDVRLLPFVQAYAKFKKDTGCVIFRSETKLYCKKGGYCGTEDKIIEIQNKKILLELKTNSLPWFTPIQLAAYLMADETPIDALRSLVLRQDGSYILSEPYNVYKALKGWQSILHTYKMKRSSKYDRFCC